MPIVSFNAAKRPGIPFNPAILSNTKAIGSMASPLSRVVRALYSPDKKPNRPMSNLLDIKGYPLTPNDYHGVIALFRIKESQWRSTQMWSSIFAEIYAPLATQAKDLRKVVKENRQAISEISKKFTEMNSATLASVKKTKTGATASIAVYRGDDTVRRALMVCVDTTTWDEYARTQSAALDMPIVAKSVSTNVLKYMSLRAQERNVFKSLNSTFRIEVTPGGSCVMYLDLTITRAQLENICNNDFADVRPVDLYGLIRTWALARTDPSISPPSSTKPLADIAATLPHGGEPRLSKDGILVDQRGDMFRIPPVVDNISRYDTALALALTGEDGTVAQWHKDATSVRKLPKQQNVFVDWVNYKWAFVNGVGNLEVEDLSRSQPCNATHIRNFLSAVIIANEAAANFVSFAASLANRVGMSLPESRLMILQGVDLIGFHPDYEGTTAQDFRLYHMRVLADMAKMPSIMTAHNKLTGASFKPYVDFCSTVHKLVEAISADVDKFYEEYAVKTIASFEARAVLFDEYADKFDAVDAQDKNRRAKYMAPMIDTAYVIPELPYMAAQKGAMPHQGNTMNALRESPDNAILSVQAGGGKTMMIVTDILKEMKSGVKGPFLVLCPAHLIAQYVIEFSYFTESRINTIPVTTYTTSQKRGGLAAIARMIEVAPINTVVLCDYNLAKGGKTVNVGYGNSSSQVYRIVEFLRQFRFNYVGCDESHMLKNLTASQSRAVGTLIADIPKKRLATGTFMANSPEDICGQFALLDPSVFGTVEDFAKEFSAGGNSGKIRKMRPGAELEILRRLKGNCRYIQVKRKEWAAILPPTVEQTHLVHLSDNQRHIYETILAASVEELKKAAATNKKLAILLGIVQMSDEDREAAMEDMDEEDKQSDMSGGLDELLRRFLARLEQFLCAPAKDKLGASLSADDRVSPKVAEFARLCREHLEKGIPGKILAFTNQIASAEEVYNNLPGDLKSQALLYTSGQKAECGSEFENNPKKTIMIGVGQSMETGLNLQFASRLVRLETVMSPGALEQGNSRIGRPNVKVTETRPATYYDWITVDHSIDVTKLAYLLTKKVRIAAIEEADNPIYANMEIPELFKLTIENITENNTEETLDPYLGPNGMYREYNKRLESDYRQFRDTHKHLLDADGKMRMIPLVRSPNLEGSSIMRRLPYVPGMSLYGTKSLGLVRMDEYLRVNADTNDEDDDGKAEVVLPGGDSTEVVDIKQRQADYLAKVKSLYVHTEQGDGEVVGGSHRGNRVNVRLPSGEIMPFSMLSVFVITKPQSSGKDVRLNLAKQAGDVPIDTPYDVPGVDEVLPTKAEIKKAEKKHNGAKNQEFALNLVVINDLLGLELDSPEDNTLAAKTLRLVQFKDAPHYYYTKLATPQVLLRFFQAVAKAKFTMSGPLSANLKAFYLQWSRMRKNAVSMFGQSTATQLRTFYNITHRPNPDTKEMVAYITVKDEQVFLCLPSQGHRGNLNVVNKVHTPGIKFYKSNPELIRFFAQPSQLTRFMQTLQQSGVSVSNEAELYADFKRLHKLVPKVTKMSMDEFFAQKDAK